MLNRHFLSKPTLQKIEYSSSVQSKTQGSRIRLKTTTWLLLLRVQFSVIKKFCVDYFIRIGNEWIAMVRSTREQGPSWRRRWEGDRDLVKPRLGQLSCQAAGGHWTYLVRCTALVSTLLWVGLDIILCICIIFLSPLLVVRQSRIFQKPVRGGKPD